MSFDALSGLWVSFDPSSPQPNASVPTLGFPSLESMTVKPMHELINEKIEAGLEYWEQVRTRPLRAVTPSLKNLSRTFRVPVVFLFVSVRACALA